jgi:metal-sulfur cluster biosynthetic enzyme
MPTQTQLRQALMEVADPEYPISVVDMGLVKWISIEGERVRVGLTFCSLGCPCVEMIREDIETRLLRCDGVAEVVIEEVFDPWSRKDISQAGLSKLRGLGVG